MKTEHAVNSLAGQGHRIVPRLTIVSVYRHGRWTSTRRVCWVCKCGFPA